MQSVGRWFLVLHIVGGDGRLKRNVTGEPVQRGVSFVSEAAGENGEGRLLGQRFEKAVKRNPLLANDQAVAILAEKNAVEPIDHRVVGNLLAAIENKPMRKVPIIIPSSGVLVLLNDVV